MNFSFHLFKFVIDQSFYFCRPKKNLKKFVCSEKWRCFKITWNDWASKKQLTAGFDQDFASKSWFLVISLIIKFDDVSKSGFGTEICQPFLKISPHFRHKPLQNQFFCQKKLNFASFDSFIMKLLFWQVLS
jgi:hypothetical protein